RVAVDGEDRPRMVAEDGAVDTLAAVGEGGVRARHLERVDGLAAEHDREVAAQVAGDAERVRGGGDPRGTDDPGELRVDGVVRRDRRGLQVDGAEVRTLVVVDVPDLAAVEGDRDGLRHERRRWRDPLLQRCREGERLEGRARLALALDGEVELALVEVPPAEHGQHAPVAWIDGDERRRRAARVGQPLGDRVARDLLQVEVDGRAYAQAAAEDPSRPVPVDEQLLHVAGEVGCRRVGRERAREPDALRRRQRGRVGGPQLRRRDVLELEYVLEDVPAARLREARVRDRVVQRRI